MAHRPMPLVRIPEPFDHPDWVFELKHDGFRALAHVRGHRCQLVSRRGHVYKFNLLAEELAHAIRANDAILDGEIVCLAPDGRSLFYPLLFRRDWPYFVAFDLLQVDGQDVRAEPLIARKRRLRAIMPRVESRVLYLPHASVVRSVCFRRPVNGISSVSSPNESEGRITKPAHPGCPQWKSG